MRLLLVIFANGFAVVSYLTFRRERTRSLLGAVVGCSVITLGLLVELVYEIAIKGSFFLTEAEVVRLQLVDGMVLVVGFLILLYSINSY